MFSFILTREASQGTGDGVSEAYNLFCEMPVYIRNHRTFVAMIGTPSPPLPVILPSGKLEWVCKSCQ